MTHSLTAFRGVFRYELLMQIRRPALWIAMLLVSAFVFRTFGGAYLSDQSLSVAAELGNWSTFLTLFYPLACGLLLADRFPRDRKNQVAEILTTTPSGVAVRLWGKYFGATVATLIPVFVIYLVGVLLITQYRHDFTALPLALMLFVANMGTAVLFVGAFSIACTTVMWPVLYQFLFVGYWFWGNFLNPRLGIPTLNQTLLMPSGRYIVDGLFPSTVITVHGLPFKTVTVAQGIGSLALLLGCAVLAQVSAWGWLRWRQQYR
ncbi:MAG TPA: hypothetical protein VFU63_01170 [Ktedonobacterales bacterium]|nr:hypothetical protein [Ktedonobacterales bacterium]